MPSDCRKEPINDNIIQKNINNGSTSIYDIKISKSDYKDSSGFKYQINNSQELKALAKKFLNK